MTLIELFVAIILATTLIGTLFSALRGQIIGSTKFDTLRAEVMQRSHIQQRLSQMFAKATSTPTIKDKSLEFTFDNGIDSSPDYCHNITAKLSQTLDGRLILTTGPALREETLMSHVSNLELELLSFDQKAPEMVHLSLHSHGPKVDYYFPLIPL